MQQGIFQRIARRIAYMTALRGQPPGAVAVTQQLRDTEPPAGTDDETQVVAGAAVASMQGVEVLRRKTRDAESDGFKIVDQAHRRNAGKGAELALILQPWLLSALSSSL